MKTDSLLTCLCLLCSFSVASATSGEVDFDREVRPILSDKCYACHGPDEGQRQGDLRLDTQDGALADLGGYAPIVPGKPSESELVRRITAGDDDVMPPADHSKQLTPKEKQTLIDWIQQGASWAAHWAYVAPQRYSPPATSYSARSKNWIDAFIFRKLEQNELEPSPTAEKRTLIRRLYFDLIGLPPSPSEVREFLSDQSEAAYEHVVDKLLRSPHFGERLAMYWLDLVRYADTVGYHGDQDVSVSPFRDYVIDAFNNNMPFDQFTREQLAGDLFDSPTNEQLIASGYNRLGMMSAEGGVQPEEYLAKYASDRVRTASTVWLGSTLGCAECHNHKFDPFTTRDFYRFASFFADIKERGLYSGANRDGNWGPYIDVPDPGLTELLEPLDDQIAETKSTLSTMTPELLERQREWESKQLAKTEIWSLLSPLQATATKDTQLSVQQDGSVLTSGNNPAQNSYTVNVELAAAATTICLEVLPDKTLPKNGPGRAGNGNFVVTEVRVRTLASSEPVAVVLNRASATFEQKAGGDNPYGKWAAAATIDNDEKGSSWGWAVLPEIDKPQALYLTSENEIPAGKLEIVIEQNHSNPNHTLGKFRLWSANNPPELELPSLLPADVQEALTISMSLRTDEQQKSLSDHFLSVAAELDPLREQLDTLEQKRTETVKKHTRTSLITVAVEPREIRVLHRGNWMDKSGDVVQPGVPQFLEQIDRVERATRLDLANWLMSRSNPLTARVFVNRLWKLYFGAGLSKILDDIGSQGERPSHPELLDTLAVEFIESGWDVKHMVKLLVISHTYRQSSLAGNGLAKVDPYNRLLARQSRYRLDAELIRDNALAISGLLVKQLGGRSAKPYQPVGLYRHLNFPTRTYQADNGPNQYRRGIYTHWQRQFLHPAMQAFDAPPREECTAERPRSNTPLAALVLLNDPSYVEAARVFAQRALQEAGVSPDSGRVNWMMRTALARDASDREHKVLHSLVDNQRVFYNKHPEKAEELHGIGLAGFDKELALDELAAWTAVARAILNMHETVTRN